MAAGRYKSWRVEVERYLVDPQPYSEVELLFVQHYLNQDGSSVPARVPVSLRDGQRAIIFLTRSVAGNEPPMEDKVFTALLGAGPVRPLGVRTIEDGQVRTVKEGEVQREPLEDFVERLVRIARDAGRLVP